MSFLSAGMQEPQLLPARSTSPICAGVSSFLDFTTSAIASSLTEKHEQMIRLGCVGLASNPARRANLAAGASVFPRAVAASAVSCRFSPAGAKWMHASRLPSITPAYRKIIFLGSEYEMISADAGIASRLRSAASESMMPESSLHPANSYIAPFKRGILHQ